MIQKLVNTLVAIAAASLVSGCTLMQTGTDVPGILKPPYSEMLFLKAQAIGVQIYGCSPSNADTKKFEWKFVAPEATLFDMAGNNIGRHYAGPTWQLNDGSKIVGEVKAKYDVPDSAAIPWLLLSAKQDSGTGQFRQVKHIQRINTIAGIAPSSGCAEAQRGKDTRVDYKATYLFYEEK